MFRKVFLLLVIGVVGMVKGYAVLPTVTITNPVSSATVSGTVNFDATASSMVIRVSFYIDDVWKGTDTIAPYRYSWDTTLYSNASHTLSVIAYDTILQPATAQISVTVNNAVPDNPPTVSITSPLNGATVSGTVVVISSASDDNGINRVEFYVDGVLKSSDTTAPYSYSWDTTASSDGVHTLKAIAVDTSSQTATVQISVTVSNAIGPLSPSVSFVSPSSGTASGTMLSGVVPVKTKVTTVATNGITKVEFYLDSNLKYTATAPESESGIFAYYNWNWDTAISSNGVHTLKAIAYCNNAPPRDKGESTMFVTVSNKYTITNSTPTGTGISAEIKPTDTVINPEKGQETKVNFMIGGKTAQAGEIVHVTIAIYNARGELVKTLIDQDMPVGEYQSMWNGRNFEEDIVASGVYIVRLRAGSYTASKKIVVIK
ncbi:MAG: Ig-like domain-containing protein [Elusimicrobiota bacterium]